MKSPNRAILVSLLVVGCSQLAQADSSSLNIALPSSPGNYASDQIRAGSLDCRNAIGSSTNVEFGVMGVIGQDDSYDGMFEPTRVPVDSMTKDIGVYAKITIPIGGPKERINCNSLFKLEMEVRRLEVMKLKQEIANLRALKFETDKPEEIKE
jgi:hypothetical protein